jgi:hypothetical protein
MPCFGGETHAHPGFQGQSMDPDFDELLGSPRRRIMSDLFDGFPLNLEDLVSAVVLVCVSGAVTVVSGLL